MVSTAMIGLLFLIIQLIPHQAIKPWLDSFAPDGSLESFSPVVFTTFKRLFFPVGLASVLVASWLFRRRGGADQILSKYLYYQQAFVASRAAEIRHLLFTLKDSVVDERDGFLLFGITGLGIWNRAILLSRQVSHDEAYTYMAFVSMGLRQVVTDYHLPNNHVFHSILVLIASELFGIQPWAIRLPAFLAGVLLIPASFLVARFFYDKETALLSAGWVASIPALVGYSANARGYSLVSLFTLLLVGLGTYLRGRNSLVGWTAFAIVAVLGFYTVPVILYPFGAVMAWLTLSALFKQVGPDYQVAPFYKMVVKTLIPVGFFVVLLVILLYSPSFINSGTQSVVGNGFVAPMEWWEFRESIPVRMANTWREWNEGIPAVLTVLLVIGLGGSVFRALSRKPVRIPLAAGAFLWISTALIIQRVAPWPRVWIFLLPMVLISSAAGLVTIFHQLGSRLHFGRFLSLTLFLTFLLVPLVMSGFNTVNIFRQSRGERGSIEELALFLKNHMSSQDVILVTAPDAVTVRYYLKQYGIEGNQVFFRDEVEYRNALVIVNQRYNQTLATVMNNRKSTSELDTDSAKIIYQRGNILVYELTSLQSSGN